MILRKMINISITIPVMTSIHIHLFYIIKNTYKNKRINIKFSLNLNKIINVIINLKDYTS